MKPGELDASPSVGDADAGSQLQPGATPPISADAVTLDLSGALGADPLSSHCEAAPEGRYSPTTIDGVVDVINRLPKPLTLPCFLRALERPLYLFASQSSISAQPAVGVRSPRTFLFWDQLILSVVPDGPGRDLLEMSFVLSNQRSIKAELKFPVRDEVSPQSAYEDILFSEITTCAQCHAQEEEIAGFGIERAFVSEALRPLPTEEVSLESLRPEVLECDPFAGGRRCAMLYGLFLYGPVVRQDFPQDMPLFGR